MKGCRNHGSRGCILEHSIKCASTSKKKILGRIFRAALIAGLVLTCGCREQIVHNLDEHDINRVLTRLEEVGISAQRNRQPDGLWSISVDSSDTFRALQHLQETRAFRTPSRSPESSSVLSSREEQRFHFERDLSKEIESTLLAIDGVLEARVHLNLPPSDPLFGQPLNKGSGSASVLLIGAREAKINRDQIGALVGGASGVDAKAVSVLLTETTISARIRPPVLPVESTSYWDNLSSMVKNDRFVVEIALSLLVLGIGLLWFGRHRFLGGGHAHSWR